MSGPPDSASAAAPPEGDGPLVAAQVVHEARALPGAAGEEAVEEGDDRVLDLAAIECGDAEEVAELRYARKAALDRCELRVGLLRIAGGEVLPRSRSPGRPPRRQPPMRTTISPLPAP
jgi:hypothetical protein